MVSMEKELVYILYLSIVLKLICGKAKICSEKQFKILKWRFCLTQVLLNHLE